MSTKIDLTEYGSQELDLNVMNDEYLYNAFMRAVRTDQFEAFLYELKEGFIFTEEQEDELRASFTTERTEYQS